MTVDGELLGTAVLELTTDGRGLSRGLAAGRATAERETAAMQRSVNRRMDAMGASMGKAGASMTRKVSVPLIGLGAAAIHMAADFDSAMERVHTQSGASQREVDQLRGKVLALSKAMGQSPTDLANALYRIEGAGYRGAKAYDALHASAELAAIGNANVEDTAKTLTQAMKPGIKGIRDFHDAVAQVNATVGAGDMRLPQLVDALGTGVVTSAKMAGLPFQDVTGALAVFGDETNNVSGWAAQLATALHFIESPTKKADKALHSMGLTDSQLAEDMHKPRGLLTALNDLKTHLSELPGGEHGVKAGQALSAIFPGGRGRVLQVLLNQVDLYEQKMNQIQATGDRTGEAFAKTQQTEAFKIHQAWATIQADLVDVGHAIGPEVLNVGEKVAHDVDRFAHAFTSLPKPLQDAIINGGLLLAAAGPALSIAGALTRTVGKLAMLASGDLAGALGKTAVSSARASQAVGTMEVGTLVARSLIGGGVPGVGGGAAREAEQVAEGAGGATLLSRLGRFAVRGSVAGLAGLAVDQGLRGYAAGPQGAFGLPTSGNGVQQFLRDFEHWNLRDPTSQLRAFGDEVQRTFGRSSTFASGIPDVELAQMADRADSLARRFPQAAGALHAFAADARRSIGVDLRESVAIAASSFDGLNLHSKNAMAQIKNEISLNTAYIAQALGPHTKAATVAMAANFRDAIKAVRRAMSDGSVSVKDGRAEIDRLRQEIKKLRDGADRNAPPTGQDIAGIGTSTVAAASAAAQAALEISINVNNLAKALKGKGITFRPAKTTAGQLTDLHVFGPLPNYGNLGLPGRAGGGFIGRPGEAGRDTVPIVVGRGEAILNRHQQAVVESYLGPGFLDSLFAAGGPPHYMAKGGKAGLPNITVTGPSGGLLRVAQGAAHYLDAAATRYIARIAPKAGKASGHGAAGTGQMRAWAAAGLRAAGVPATAENVSIIVGRMAQESGGNPHAINLWDSNAAAGHPSKGLMQTIASTFAAYHVSGTSNDIYDPVANVAAAVRYMLAVYGHLVGAGPGGYSLGGRVLGFASGGRVGTGGTRATASMPRRSRRSKTGHHPATHKPRLPSVLTLAKAGYPMKDYRSLAGLLGDGPTSIAAMIEAEANQSTIFDRSQETFVVTPADGSDPYIDQAAVAQRVGELQTLLGMENPILSTVQSASDLDRQVHAQIQKARDAAIKRRNAIRKRARDLLNKIRDLQKKIRTAQRTIAKEQKSRHPNKALIAYEQRRINHWTKQLGPLQHELNQLTGDTTSIGTGGELGRENAQIDQANQALTDTDDWRKSLTGLSGTGGTRFDVQGVLYDLQTQLGQLSPQALADSLAQAKGSGSATSATSPLDDLTKQQLETTQQLLAVSQAQYRDVFSRIGDLPPFGGSFLTGGTVPGPPGAARTIIAHGGEGVLDRGTTAAIGPGLAQLGARLAGIEQALGSLAAAGGEDALLRRAIGKAAAQEIGRSARQRSRVPVRNVQ